MLNMNIERKERQEKPVIKSVGQAEKIISTILLEQNSSNSVKNVYEIIDNLLEDSNKIYGEVDDFHNLSVSIANLNDDYETAFEIIQRGLSIHPTNTDLIADIIRYGYNCGKYQDCAIWFENLNRITKRKWTWRAYSFTIDYLTNILDQFLEITDAEYESRFNQILDFVEQYKNAFPDKEDSYYSEFEVYWNTNNREKAVSVLKEKSNDEQYCPKIWLRYADILIDRGQLTEAENLVTKLIEDTQLSENGNSSYIYYLDGKCKVSKLLKSKDYIYDDVQKAYKSFSIALQSNPHANLQLKIKKSVHRLQIESEIESNYPV